MLLMLDNRISNAKTCPPDFYPIQYKGKTMCVRHSGFRPIKPGSYGKQSSSSQGNSTNNSNQHSNHPHSMDVPGAGSPGGGEINGNTGPGAPGNPPPGDWHPGGGGCLHCHLE